MFSIDKWKVYHAITIDAKTQLTDDRSHLNVNNSC